LERTKEVTILCSGSGVDCVDWACSAGP